MLRVENDVSRKTDKSVGKAHVEEKIGVEATEEEKDVVKAPKHGVEATENDVDGTNDVDTTKEETIDDEAATNDVDTTKEGRNDVDTTADTTQAETTLDTTNASFVGASEAESDQTPRLRPAAADESLVPPKVRLQLRVQVAPLSGGRIEGSAIGVRGSVFRVCASLRFPPLGASARDAIANGRSTRKRRKRGNMERRAPTTRRNPTWRERRRRRRRKTSALLVSRNLQSVTRRVHRS